MAAASAVMPVCEQTSGVSGLECVQPRVEKEARNALGQMTQLKGCLLHQFEQPQRMTAGVARAPAMLLLNSLHPDTAGMTNKL